MKKKNKIKSINKAKEINLNINEKKKKMHHKIQQKKNFLKQNLILHQILK